MAERFKVNIPNIRNVYNDEIGPEERAWLKVQHPADYAYFVKQEKAFEAENAPKSKAKTATASKAVASKAAPAKATAPTKATTTASKPTAPTSAVERNAQDAEGEKESVSAPATTQGEGGK